MYYHCQYDPNKLSFNSSKNLILSGKLNIVSNGFEHPQHSHLFCRTYIFIHGPLQKNGRFSPRTSSRLLKDRPLVIVDQKTLTKTKVKLQLAAIWFLHTLIKFELDFSIHLQTGFSHQICGPQICTLEIRSKARLSPTIFGRG